MRRFVVVALAAVALSATAPAALGHDDRIEYVCEKADGDHLFLTANHAAADGLSTSIAATAEVTLELFGAVCRVAE